MANVSLKIGEVAKTVSLNPRTIRYYESRGLLKGGRILSGYRVFGEGDLVQLKLIKQLRKLGFSISETRQVLPVLVNSFPRSQRTEMLKALLERRLAAVAEHLRELAASHRELQDKLARLSSRRTPTRDSCCEPFCGPETCGPGLVQITGLQREGGNR